MPARGLAKEPMDRADLLPEVDNSHLEALPREYVKSDLWKIERRQREIDPNMSLPKSKTKEMSRNKTFRLSSFNKEESQAFLFCF